MELQGLSDEVKARYVLLRDEFLVELPNRWAEIQQCKDEPGRLCDVLHKLCGVAGGFGLSALAALAKIAEQQVLDGQLQEMVATLDRLHDEIQRLTRPLSV
jgi:HPt (histidine-containing phosphotransfer) domain-containing protein